MAEKMTCPGCDSHTSDVLRAFGEGEPCPYCHLSADAAREVLAARSRHGDEALKADLAAALIRAGKAESEVASLRQRLDALRFAVRAALEEDG